MGGFLRIRSVAHFVVRLKERFEEGWRGLGVLGEGGWLRGGRAMGRGFGVDAW